MIVALLRSARVALCLFVEGAAVLVALSHPSWVSGQRRVLLAYVHVACVVFCAALPFICHYNYNCYNLGATAQETVPAKREREDRRDAAVCVDLGRVNSAVVQRLRYVRTYV